MIAQVKDLQPDPLAVAARDLQGRHAVSTHRPRPGAPWSRLRRISSWLHRARAAAANPSPEATKAAEWLLDNDYQVQRAVVQIEQDLPTGFYKRLPILKGPGDEGVPRILAIAYGLLHTSHLQLSLMTAVRFVQAYQQGAPLTIAELWALPTMLRLACLEVLTCGWTRLFPNVEPPFAPTRQRPAGSEWC